LAAMSVMMALSMLSPPDDPFSGGDYSMAAASAYQS
jgi:hypothetical protein